MAAFTLLARSLRGGGGGTSFSGRRSALHTSAWSARGSKNLDWYYNALQEREDEKTRVEQPVFPPEPLHGRKRSRAFIDFQSGAEGSGEAAPLGRVVVELADDLVPLTVRNFLALCERPTGNGYRGSAAFQVRKGLGVMFGDWSSGDGRGGESSFGTKYFSDENFIVRHSAPGVLTMANAGVHSNSSIFMVTLSKQPHLDGRNVAFGRILTGMDVMQKIGGVFCVNLRPATPIVIKDAGPLPAAQWAAVDKAVAAEAKAAAAAQAAAGAAAAAKAAKEDKMKEKKVAVT